MAGQLWAVNSLGGYMYSLELSDILRTAVQPLCKFRQFCDAKDFTDKGLHKGQLFTWNVYNDIATALDVALLNALSVVKRNGGEAPAEIEQMIREVIPSQADAGHRQADDEATEGVETRSVSPNNNPTHECPTPLRVVSHGTKR